MLAARLSDPELAVLLLDVGAEPSAADENGRTALHVAAWNAGPEMIWALLEHGADPGRTLSPSEQTPAMLAGRRKESYGVDVRWAFEGRTPPEYATVSDQVELAIDRPAPAIECTRTEMERSPELPFVLVNISLKVEPFPLDLAFDVSLRQRGAAFPANPLVVPAGTAVDGQAFQVFAPSLEPGSIELLLRPSRDVAVRKLPRPTAIWGGEVMLRCELVEKR